MNVKVNGSDSELAGGTTVLNVVEKTVDPNGAGIAVALNGEVVSRSRWNDTELADGDRVEVLGAIGGGARKETAGRGDG